MYVCRLQSLVVPSFLFLTAQAQAAAPAVDYLYPAGGQQGTSVTFTVGGAKGEAKLEPWPVSVWSEGSGLKFKPGEKNGQFSVDIAADCPPGPHLVRFHNADGASAPRLFVVSRHVEQVEPRSKDASGEPHAVTALPAVLNGQLEKRGESDAWAVEVEAGKWIVADLQARRLGAPIDAALQLVDSDGAVVAFGHDVFGLDPLVAYQTPRAGRYVIQVAGFAHPPSSDVRFAGSPATIYRLNVTTGPFARYAFPPVVPASGKTRVRLFGWNLPAAGDGGEGVSVEVEPTAAAAAVAAPGLDNFLRLPVAERAGGDDVEPNDDVPQPLEVPGAIDGRLQQPGDTDRYAITVKKGENVVLSVAAREIFSPIDPVLTITDADGKEVAREDDTGGVAQDPRLDWRAPADGTFIVTVADLHRGGGPAHVYRLDAVRAAAGCTAIAETSSVLLKPGASAVLKLKITRPQGDTSALKVIADGLPSGVSATPVDVPAKGGSVTLTLKADASAAPANLPFVVRLVGDDKPVTAHFATSIDFAPQTPFLWLTVAGKPAADAAKKPQK